jgi:hypothetical protein
MIKPATNQVLPSMYIARPTTSRSEYASKHDSSQHVPTISECACLDGLCDPQHSEMLHWSDLMIGSRRENDSKTKRWQIKGLRMGDSSYDQSFQHVDTLKGSYSTRHSRMKSHVRRHPNHPISPPRPTTTITPSHQHSVPPPPRLTNTRLSTLSHHHPVLPSCHAWPRAPSNWCLNTIITCYVQKHLFQHF